MKTYAIILSSDPSKLLLFEALERPVYSEIVRHPNYYWEVNKYDIMVKDWERSMVIAQSHALPCANPDFIEFTTGNTSSSAFTNVGVLQVNTPFLLNDFDIEETEINNTKTITREDGSTYEEIIAFSHCMAYKLLSKSLTASH
jgi:hypothetical protein